MFNFGDKCTISRPVKQENVYGPRKTAEYEELTNVPCRLRTKQKRGFNSLTAEFVTQTTIELLIAKDVDIRPQDTIKDIVYQGGNELFNTTYKVESIVPKRGRFIVYQLATLKQIA